ncbi:MAG: protein kinase [Myxococcales bacterium]|mgnify:CR=1 FL=1|nr:protein kinase [Myxococcales bacterium]MBL0192691.1 protein kinase [Myxococcales bacterium]HQY63987.1 serine/threonine-protein kinase [Polyangiaceae bacterium]
MDSTITPDSSEPSSPAEGASPAITDTLEPCASSDDLDTLAMAATIGPLGPADPRWTLDTLAHLRGAAPGVFSAGPAGGLALGPVLGEGGMGIVRSATQRSLGRDVAVKTLRKEPHASGLGIGRLLREALITGSLEHPNVVPVYDLGLDAEGSPMLVLKRISGVSLRDLLADPDLVEARFATSDVLEWHLRTLMQVCSAVHFAHRRGIVHRDIKPDNIMVGEFGEVYVLDWGIAVALTDDGTNRFPLAEEAIDIAGTPLYMAPEMFGGAPPDERTDVYLLGATLYEIVAGRPPHEGDTLVEIMASMAAPPPVPESAPPELVAAWQTAMAHEREARQPSAEALRLAIQRYLDHRASHRLAAGAQASLAELERRLAAAAPGTAEGREAIYNLFGECAFGFRQALQEWSANEQARAGLRQATVRLARYEIAHDDPRAARLLVARLDPPDEALSAEVVELEGRAARSAARVQALEALGKDMDPNAGRRGRAALLVVLGLLWILVPLLVGQFYAANPDYGALVPVPGALLGVVLISGFVARRSMGRTAMNRAILGALAIAFFAQLMMHVGSWLAKVPPDESQRLIPYIWFLIAAMMSVTVIPRLALPAAGYLAAYFAISRWFASRYEIMAASNALLLATVLVTFVERRDAVPSREGSRQP